jgi:hypothetical protein
MSREDSREAKRGWKVFFALLIWCSVMVAIWFLWPGPE